MRKGNRLGENISNYIVIKVVKHPTQTTYTNKFIENAVISVVKSKLVIIKIFLSNTFMYMSNSFMYMILMLNVLIMHLWNSVRIQWELLQTYYNHSACKM